MKRISILILTGAVAIALLFSSATAQNKQWKPGSRAPQAGDEYINPKDGTVLVFIPGGEFTMGSDSGDADEKPAHKQTVQGFWLGKYEVTNQQYQKFRDAEGYPDPQAMDDPAFNAPNQPVIGVKFMHAQSYVKWAGLRMPTEAEWEYAASGGKNLKYPTKTGEINHDLANYLGKEGADKWEDVPSPVGSFPPNPFGIYDLAGNAWEWTSSMYRNYPYSATDGRENQTDRRHRVMRGGTFHFGEKYIRTTHRHHFAMHLRLDYAGMRMAASTDQLK